MKPILWAPASDAPLVPSRALTYNEECARTGGRSYTCAPQRVIPPVVHRPRVKCPHVNGSVCRICYPLGEFS